MFLIVLDFVSAPRAQLFFVRLQGLNLLGYDQDVKRDVGVKKGGLLRGVLKSFCLLCDYEVTERFCQELLEIYISRKILSGACKVIKKFRI